MGGEDVTGPLFLEASCLVPVPAAVMLCHLPGLCCHLGCWFFFLVSCLGLECPLKAQEWGAAPQRSSVQGGSGEVVDPEGSPHYWINNWVALWEVMAAARGGARGRSGASGVCWGLCLGSGLFPALCFLVIMS